MPLDMPSNSEQFMGYASSLVNPMSWYGFMPGLWSFNEGLYVPFGKNIYNKIRGREVTPSSFKPTFKKPFKSAGAILGGKFRIGSNTLAEAKMAQQSVLSTHTYITNKLVASGLSNKKAFSQARTLTGEFFKKVAPKAEEFMNASRNKTFTTNSKYGGKMGLSSQFSHISEGLINDVFKGANNVPKNVAGKLAAGRLTQAAMMLGKGASVVGLLGLTWDITQAIGQPLGRAAVGVANKVLTDWENRFMPEMGGQLALSYVSRGAATERQRAIEAISKAHLNGRSALGNEAQFYH